MHSNGTSSKPQLHVSMLDMFSRCGIQFQRRYGARFGVWHEEEVIPPGVALVTGISVHKSVEGNLRNKLTTGQLLPAEQVRDLARDEFHRNYASGMMFTEDEAIDLSKTVGTAVDQTVTLAELHHGAVAPMIAPLAVEEKFVLNQTHFPFDLAGTIDIRTLAGIRDTKTSTSSPPQDAAMTIQNAMYSLAHKVRSGSLPESVSNDYLVKTKTAKVEFRSAKPEPSWIERLMRRVERFATIVETVKSGKDCFSPAQSDEWQCSRRYCGFSATCPFASGR